MRILVIGGTRYFGVPMIDKFLTNGHQVAVLTRGRTPDKWGSKVSHIIADRLDSDALATALKDCSFDIVIDKIAYASNDILRLPDTLKCDKYILMSSTAVYNPLKPDTRESDFDPKQGVLIPCSRGDYPYDEIKRQAERAAVQKYSHIKSVLVRYPFVIGPHDYTQRLKFYVEHQLRGIPMNIDNLEAQMSFIWEEDAGYFLAHLCETDFEGPINGASNGTVSIRDVLDMTEELTGKKPILDMNGEAAPYNGTPANSVNTESAGKTGFEFSDIVPKVRELVRMYVEETENPGNCNL